MTVGETLTASSLGSASAGGSVPTEPVNDSRQKPAEVNQPLGGPSVNVVTAKIGQELVTSLHLIKDIRRLEKYQRDFFLKVKESLSHVQVLLDHQLMDMAWSDNLIDCEENLLRVSNHIQQQSPNNAATAQQMAELYGILLHDREKLNHRFSELSIKSSLSEFVVNSRQLLDINAVRIAAEAILKNEKPIPAQGDHSIPVDHTFFLANFCTASLASSTMASFLPKQPAVALASGNYPVSNAGPSNNRYDNKKVNGAGPMPNQGSSPSSMNMKNSHVRSNTTGAGPNAANNSQAAVAAAGINGIAAGMAEVINSGPGGPPPSASGNSFSGMYNDSADNYLGPVVADMSNGMYGQHELVAAISQITENQAGGVPQPPQPNKAFKAKKLWSESQQANTASAGKDKAADKAASKTRYSNNQGNEINIPNDGASDSLSSTSEEVAANAAASAAAAAAAAAAAVTSGEIGDNGKPLSFARIASLNLEKQALQRLPKAVANNNGQQPIVPASANSTDNMMMTAVAMNANSNLALATAAASMASMNAMSMAEAAVVAAATQQGHMGHHHQMASAAAGMGGPYSNPAMAMAMAAHMPIVQLPPTNNPRFFFDIAMDGKRLGRAIIEVQAALAPKMAQNFHMLATSEKGFGYRGCHFFQAWRNESVICGDWEHNSGRGGRAAIDEGPLFTPDETKLPCIRGAVGMRRMSKKHSSLNQVASQFRVILANMNTQFTGIFGHVVSGIEALDKVADIGGEGGRPEKIALVTTCGIYKG